MILPGMATGPEYSLQRTFVCLKRLHKAQCHFGGGGTGSLRARLLHLRDSLFEMSAQQEPVAAEAFLQHLGCGHGAGPQNLWRHAALLAQELQQTAMGCGDGGIRGSGAFV